MFILRLFITILLIFFFITGCGVNDYIQIAQIAHSKNPSYAIKTFVERKERYYLTHPYALKRDIEYFIRNYKQELSKFLKEISIWPTLKKPSTTTFVKYTYHYKARAIINFEKGIVKVESLKKEYMKKALVNTMLMPDDPRSVDVFSDKLSLKGKPFLAYQIYDFENKPVLYKWRAERYAKWLIIHRLKKTKKNGKIIYYVTFNLSKNALSVREKRYLPYVRMYSKRYSISKPLILGIIKTESDFNPYAVSYVPAFGLMQIVPTTAGVEGYKRAYGYKKIPSKEFLFVPKNNINLGTAYLNILFYRYLREIKNPISREYLAIASYNSGIGNVLKVFSLRRDRAIAIINGLTPKEVYIRLIHRLPTEEGRRYLPKVLNNKKRYIKV